ncbi:MAG: pyridoxal 5'-phosphate synthase glutaminase subunit PdxT, partial [Nitrosopumilaceae archaeon]
LLDLLDVKVERNSFGRQLDSFEADISMESIKIPKFNGVFIRSPSILEVGKNVEVISKLNEKTIAVKQKNILATVFHPELTHDVSMHKYFINMIK